MESVNIRVSTLLRGATVVTIVLAFLGGGCWSSEDSSESRGAKESLQSESSSQDGQRQSDTVAVNPSSPEEAVALWYRAIREKDRQLLNRVMTGGVQGFQFGDSDSLAYEIERRKTIDDKDDVNSHPAALIGDVVILTKRWNPATGDTLDGHHFILRKRKSQWTVYGYSSRAYSRENLPPEMR